MASNQHVRDAGDVCGLTGREMTETIAIRLWNPQQAHAAIATQLWPTIKAMLMAGHRLELACKPEKRSRQKTGYCMP